jgi:dipeptidyl aminopeptidase/acylaminoacyl peptidase
VVNTGFNRKVNSYIELGYAVLMVNYRGSAGNGDAILQSIIGGIGQVRFIIIQ